MTEKREEREITLVVFVESQLHSAAELTAMLGGLAPDESWERGTPFRFGTREKLRDTSSWLVLERATGNAHCSDAAARLVARLRHIIPSFQALPAGVEVSFRILVNEDNDVFGLGLDREHVKFVEEIRADIDISVVVSMPMERAPTAQDSS